ncbi:protein pangolin, isoforms A/H/I/S [Stomoxys calcitrans]|uniref:dTCF n=1 Tax=Stomoxys calcitrans TaxID=35570 RepID=A0A1I8PXX4_STOCA|nr:protein pangolin, isoforms A/H/I/S [Stomoxys calcitrans]
MPHTSHARHTSSSGDDLGSTDEVKVFKDEGDREDEKISSENLLEEKSSLIDLTESEEKSGKISTRSGQSPVFNKIEPHASPYSMGYLVSPYPYSNGSTGGLPATMANKIGLPCFFGHNGEHLTTPPPAHCGIPPYQLDAKSINLSRQAIYPFPSSQYPYPMISPDMSQVATWHTPSVYSAASSFRNPYPTSLPINSTLSSDFSFRFSPNLLPSVHTSQHHMLNAHSTASASGSKQDGNNDTAGTHRFLKNMESRNVRMQNHETCKDSAIEKKKPHIKKPLNAFMLYMKEMRAKVVAECTLKESAAINQILGRRWHELSREEQSKYYEKARQERQLHMELYPGWSARDNYGYVSKKKKRKKDRSPADSGGNNMKKCRARFGLDQQNQWCKPCKRKKKCIRYMESIGIGCDSVKEEHLNDLDDTDGQRSDDDDVDHENIGSCDSGDDNKVYDDDNESLSHSLSSPSGFSNFQSPPTSLASPAIVHHVNDSINTGFNDHNHNHPDLNILQSQSVQIQHQHKLQQHFQPSISMSSLCPTPHLAYETGGLVGNNPNSISNIVSTINASPTPSSTTVSAYGSKCLPSASTSSSLPASLSDRMMRSLLSSSPAMLLGNRLSHLAMGLAMNNNNNIIGNGIHGTNSSISTDKLFNSLDTSCAKKEELNTAPATEFKTIYNRSSSAANMNQLEDTEKVLSSSVTDTISSQKSLSTSKSCSLPAISLTESTNPMNIKINSNSNIPFQRSPIGANPRDINNPLSINQLTKRPHDENSTTNSDDINSCASNMRDSKVVSGDMSFIRSHHAQQMHTAIPLPPPTQSAIYNNSQHFQQKFIRHSVTPIPATTTSSSPVVTQTSEKSNSIKSGGSQKLSTDTSNESGAINVT